jgi:thiol-disulfide isomerase/thioredoxin
MKIKTLILLFLSAISLSVLASPQTSNKVIITGEIENSNIMKKNFVEIAINRIAFRQLSNKFAVDKQGRFRCEFTVSTPTDVYLIYRSLFKIAVHPGDSIHVVFDGSKRESSELRKTVRFSGSAVKLNQDITMLQQLYYDSELFFNGDVSRSKKEVKRLNPNEYVECKTKLKNSILKTFIDTQKPSEESMLWANVFLTSNELRNAYYYKTERKEYYKSDSVAWSINCDSTFLHMLPITESMYICGEGLSGFVNWYHHGFVVPRVYSDLNKILNDIQQKSNYTIDLPAFKELSASFEDSLWVNGIVKYTPDTLLRQMVLTEYFSHQFDHASISAYEKYIDVVHKYIQLPFLAQPLAWHYEDTKKKVVNPTLTSETILKESSNSSIAAIIDSVTTKHKNKVIYIDCWATWCGPCLGEMPNSKILMDYMKGKDVAFVYICIDSKEKEWKALIDKHQLKGEHYLLTQSQSADMRKIFEITGIPRYIIIDKKGNVLGKDYNLRPSEAKSAIEKLL